MANNSPPSSIILHKQSKSLELVYDEQSYFLPAEYLRVSSPSAEVRGHGEGTEVLQVHKENVGITQLEPVGQYALKIVFDDGHDSGLFTWDYLRKLSFEQTELWQNYLALLVEAGYQRQQ
jgi:DUF971 family protein